MRNCFECKKETKNKKFCGRSCAATYNNKRVPKRQKTRVCKRESCIQLAGTGRSYCSNDCFRTAIAERPKRTAKINPANQEWRRKWLQKDTEKRRNRARQYLGGRCVKCGSTDNLEFDHIDRTTKEFTIGHHYNKPWDQLQIELDKCQLLCKTHHLEKTGNELKGRVPWNKGKGGATFDNHGTYKMYYSLKCRCEFCEIWHAKHLAKRRIQK